MTISVTILETVLYAADLAAAEAFYARLLGTEPYARVEGRHVFFKLEGQMLLIFNPEATRKPAVGKLPVPAHGADGEGHVCFSAAPLGIDAWRNRVAGQGLSMEADFEWPGGGRSIYLRDPAGNSVEFAEPRIWGF